MKKYLLSLAILLSGGSSMWADNYVVNNVTVPQGGTAALEIGLNNPTIECGGFEFLLVLDNGITASAPEKGSRVGSSFTLQGNNKAGEGFQVLAYNTEALVIDGTSGTIVTLTLTADAGLAVGSTLNGSIKSAYISNRGGESNSAENVNFTITIGEPETRTVLDEASTKAPAAATGVDVRVKRTITANDWNTICLPFAMNEAQTKAAFGNDVQLGNFTGYEVEEDGGGDIIGLRMNFSSVTAIEANHPYIIKVSSAISEFTADGVDIDPEDEPMVNYGTSRKPKSIVGTYVAETDVPELCLFLSGNKFWYSIGATKMKAFRAYFDFVDVLTDVEDTYGVKMFIHHADDETGIEEIQMSNGSNNGEIYDLAGRRVEKANKGIYIINNKKVLVK